MRSRHAGIDRISVVIGRIRVRSAKQALRGSLPSSIFDTGRATAEQKSEDVRFIIGLFLRLLCLAG